MGGPCLVGGWRESLADAVELCQKAARAASRGGALASIDRPEAGPDEHLDGGAPAVKDERGRANLVPRSGTGNTKRRARSIRAHAVRSPR